MIFNISTLMSNVSLGDDELVETKVACQLLGAPDKPVSSKFVSRAKQASPGLEYVDIGGRHFFRIGALRALVRSRMHRPNPHRGARHVRIQV